MASDFGVGAVYNSKLREKVPPERHLMFCYTGPTSPLLAEPRISPSRWKHAAEAHGATQTWTATFSTPEPAVRLLATALNSTGVAISGAEQEITLAPLPALTLQREGGELIFDYPAPRTGAYQLQAAASLAGPDWQTIDAQQANGGTVQFRTVVPAAPVMFYRIVEP